MTNGPQRSGGLPMLHQLISAVLAALVLLQAVLAGQSDQLFGTIGIDVHGAVANVVFVLVVANLVLGWRAELRRGQLLVLASLFAAVSVQTGLGYAGRTSLDAAAWHIPTGVAIFGLAVASLTLSLIHRPGDRPSESERGLGPVRPGGGSFDSSAVGQSSIRRVVEVPPIRIGAGRMAPSTARSSNPAAGGRSRAPVEVFPHGDLASLGTDLGVFGGLVPRDDLGKAR